MSESSKVPLATIRQQLLDGMLDYMLADEEENSPNPNCTYTQNEIDRLTRIVDKYLKAMSAISPGDQSAICELVKTTVLQLNMLNEKVSGSLFQPDQRNDLLELIQGAARNAGYGVQNDITAEWRNW